MPREIEISALNHRPVKSCGTRAVTELEIGENGPKYGRHWMITDPFGKFLLSDKYPRMALINPMLIGNELVLAGDGTETQVTIPINDRGTRAVVEMFAGKKYQAIDDGQEAAIWLSDFLGTDCRLVHIPEDFIRTDSRGIARLGFADSWSMSLSSDESLADLNEKILQNGRNPVPRERFGHDVWVTGVKAYDEDSWGEISINGVAIAVIKPIERCARTLVKREDTTEINKKDIEPLATLNRHRKIKTEDGYGVVFGQKMAHQNTGVLHVGDKVNVLKHKLSPEFVVKS